MDLHFYTSFESVENIEQGNHIQVWNKSEAKETDIHISLNTDDYIISETRIKTVYIANKITWKIPQSPIIR